MLNRCIFTGRVTHDLELKTTSANDYVCNFSLAVQRNYKTDNDYITDFINFVAWRKNAEIIARHFKKGDMICIEGSLIPRSYRDSNDNKRVLYEIVVDNFYFV